MEYQEKKYKDIEVHSDEVQEVMSEISPWILRWGITTLFVIVIALFIGSYFFKYPDTLIANITVTSLNPPVSIIARTTGSIDEIFIKNNQIVKEGTPLAVIQNSANTQDVLKLVYTMDEWKLSGYSENKINDLFIDKSLSLGSIQSAYASFIVSLSDYLNYKQLKNMQLSRGKKNLFELQKQSSELGKKYLLSLRNATESLNTQIKSWKHDYLLVSPITGIVTQMGIWSSHQNVNAGESVFSIMPSQKIIPKGMAMLPIQGAGKVKIGQRVNVRINNFPDQEFGYLLGKVESISSIPTPEGFYVVEIDFPKGMRTNYGKTLPFTQQMLGSAEIITEDLRLIERFFMPVKKLLKNQQ